MLHQLASLGIREVANKVGPLVVVEAIRVLPSEIEETELVEEAVVEGAVVGAEAEAQAEAEGVGAQAEAKEAKAADMISL